MFFSLVISIERERERLKKEGSESGLTGFVLDPDAIRKNRLAPLEGDSLSCRVARFQFRVLRVKKKAA